MLTPPDGAALAVEAAAAPEAAELIECPPVGEALGELVGYDGGITGLGLLGWFGSWLGWFCCCNAHVTNLIRCISYGLHSREPAREEAC